MPLIPEKLTNFRCYAGAGGTELLGVTDVELPNFEPMTEEIRGAGLAGAYDSPVIGHFGSQQLTLRWRATTDKALDLLAPIQHAFQLRGSIQIQDSTNGALATQALYIDVRGQTKSENLGKLEAGTMMEAETVIEVARIVITLGGTNLVEFDKFNMVYKVRGTDYLRAVRQDLGG